MNYKMNEGTFSVPENWQDETLHIFKAPDAEGYNLVVNRDRVPRGMTKEEYLEEQLNAIRDNLGDFRENSLKYIEAGDEECPLLDYNWSSPEGRMHQLNLMWVRPPVMLSFTFSSMKKYTENQKKTLTEILQSFQPYGPDES